ncbi:hypothetical protein [Scytonema hofmannii]|uniref:hypothetical protein n=1 Tax=Scytonema hofmannii TaxID=34078 RepID=UPI0003460931|nr:hypothetical protein [Scytonema hofmannii]
MSILAKAIWSAVNQCDNKIPKKLTKKTNIKKRIRALKAYNSLKKAFLEVAV